MQRKMGKIMFNSLEEQLDFEAQIGLSPDRKHGHVPVAFGAVQAQLSENGDSPEEITEEIFDRARENLLGVVRLIRPESQA